jgi:hypothetical protein
MSLERNGDIIHDLRQNVKGFCKSFLSFFEKVFAGGNRIGASLFFTKMPPAMAAEGLVIRLS